MILLLYHQKVIIIQNDCELTCDVYLRDTESQLAGSKHCVMEIAEDRNLISVDCCFSQLWRLFRSCFITAFLQEKHMTIYYFYPILHYDFMKFYHQVVSGSRSFASTLGRQSILSISSGLITKPSKSMFSRILSGVFDFGSGIHPF